MTIATTSEESQDQGLESIALTVQNVADLLDIDKQTVYRLIKAGQLKARRVGDRRYRILKEDFESFIERALVSPVKKDGEEKN